MRKFILFIFIVLLTLSSLGQTNKEVVINNKTSNEYLGLYFEDYIPLKDMYITKESQANGDFKYKTFLVRPDRVFNKIFAKTYNFKLYQIKDSTYFEVLTFKLNYSLIQLDIYNTYYELKKL